MIGNDEQSVPCRCQTNSQVGWAPPTVYGLVWRTRWAIPTLRGSIWPGSRTVVLVEAGAMSRVSGGKSTVPGLPARALGALRGSGYWLAPTMYDTAAFTSSSDRSVRPPLGGIIPALP